MRAPALILIDVQKGFVGKEATHWGTERNNPDAEMNMLALLSHWRENAWPVVHIKHRSTSKHSPLRPEASGHDFQPGFEPLAGEAQMTKTVNSAYIDTGLTEFLRSQDISSVVHIGLTTDHCVSTSTRMAANLGFQVTVITDAVATFDRTDHQGEHYDAETIHRVNLASLNGEFATLSTTKALLDAHRA